MMNIASSSKGWFLDNEDGFELKVDGERYTVPKRSSFSNDKVEVWDLTNSAGEKVGVLKAPTSAKACYFKIYGGKEYYMIKKMFRRVRWGMKDVAPVFPAGD